LYEGITTLILGHAKPSGGAGAGVGSTFHGHSSLSVEGRGSSDRIIGPTGLRGVRCSDRPQRLEPTMVRIALLLQVEARSRVVGRRCAELPRLALLFNRRRVGRLRLLIDRLNAWEPEVHGRHGASPRAITEGAIPAEAERAELDEEP
jgi:hypothetical protein